MAAAEHKPPERVGEYRIVRQLGAGGFGAVYEGLHGSLGRRAAIKILYAELASKPEMAQRFLNEARAVNLIRHAGIVDISDCGQLDNGEVFIIMEFLDGVALSGHLRKEGGRLALLPTLRLGHQLAAALCAAHEKGIVHRDLKPDNVMLLADPLVPGALRTKLLDFGIAKLAEEHTAPGQPQTRTGMMMGTPAYMSPEQCRGAGQVDSKSDVYSLGVMLYQMLCGSRPFDGQGEGEIIGKHLYVAPKPLHEVDPTIDRDTADLILRMLAKEPADRPTMKEVAESLQRLEQPRPQAATKISAPSTSPAPSPVVAKEESQRARRKPLPLLIGGGLLLLTSAGVMVGVLRSKTPSTPTSTEKPAQTLAVAPPAPQPTSVPHPETTTPPATSPAPVEATPHNDGPKHHGAKHGQAREERTHGHNAKTEAAPAQPETPAPKPAAPAAPAEQPAPAGPDPKTKSTIDAAKLEYAFGRYGNALSLARSVRTEKAAMRILGAAACRTGDLGQASEAYGDAGAAERSYIEAECQKAGARLSGGRFVSAPAPQK